MEAVKLCLHKQGEFVEITQFCDAVMVFMHIHPDCNGVRFEEWET